MWAQTIGHQNQIAQLKQTAETERLPHAYIFSGLQGIGKKRVALGLAQFLACSSEKKPCEQCEACLKISKSLHPDLFFISPAGKTIKVDTLRDLKQKVYLHPLETTTRIILIEEAEKMTEAGANALLKILEEPPANNIFILITDRPNQLLPTILSRCHLLSFAPLTTQQIEQILMREGMENREASTRSLLSQGSLQTAREISPTLYDEARTFLKKIESLKSVTDLLELGEELHQHEQLKHILELWQIAYHASMLHAPEPQLQKKLAAWEEIQKTLRELEAYSNKQLLVENLLFKLAAA